MQKLIKYGEKTIIWGILIVMSVILILAFIDIIYEIKLRLLTPPRYMIDVNGLMELFSIFLTLLIGIELLQTVKAYLKDDLVHVEFIILVAIIAITRKVIVWDFNRNSFEELVSLAIVIVALGFTYFLIRKADIKLKVKKRKRN